MAARNFDELLEEDLSFTLGGREFRMVYVRPEVLAAWEDDPQDNTAAESLKRLDDRIKIFLPDDEQRAAYDEIRARDENPVTMSQLNALATWMIEVQSDRPTPPPSPSASGRGSKGRTSGAA